jgi:hypothetical protein
VVMWRDLGANKGSSAEHKPQHSSPSRQALVHFINSSPEVHL